MVLFCFGLGKEELTRLAKMICEKLGPNPQLVPFNMLLRRNKTELWILSSGVAFKRTRGIRYGALDCAKTG